MRGGIGRHGEAWQAPTQPSEQRPRGLCLGRSTRVACCGGGGVWPEWPEREEKATGQEEEERGAGVLRARSTPYVGLCSTIGLGLGLGLGYELGLGAGVGVRVRGRSTVRRLVLDDRVGPRGEGVLQQPHQRVRLVGLARKPRQLHLHTGARSERRRRVSDQVRAQKAPRPKVGAHPVWAKRDVADLMGIGERAAAQLRAAGGGGRRRTAAHIGRRSGNVDRRVLMEDEPVDEVRGARTRGDKEIKPAG